jgi:hypothetical protein
MDPLWFKGMKPRTFAGPLTDDQVAAEVARDALMAGVEPLSDDRTWICGSGITAGSRSTRGCGRGSALPASGCPATRPLGASTPSAPPDVSSSAFATLGGMPWAAGRRLAEPIGGTPTGRHPAANQPAAEVHRLSRLRAQIAAVLRVG